MKKNNVNYPILMVIISLAMLSAGYLLAEKNFPFSKARPNTELLKQRINPDKGFKLNVSFRDLGPKMLDAGIIDLEKFKSVYEDSGQALTADQLRILTNGSQEKIRISKENAYFLLNFFWAVGLANKSALLLEGPISKESSELANYASTGGWTLSKSDPMNYFAKSELIELSKKQEGRVREAAESSYRPCCDNPTSFPDCNHGMALLGVYELMASSDASVDQMLEAGKYFNAFWFPENYYQIANYLENKMGKQFKDIPGRVILARENSSASGYQNALEWLTDNGLFKSPSGSGAKCSS